MVNYFVSIYYRIITYKKCLLIRLKGGKITIGENTNIHPSTMLSATKGSEIIIGSNCSVLKGVIIATYGGKIKIGDNLSINPYAILYGHGGLEIGNDVRIAAHAVIVPAEHNFMDKNSPIYKQGLSTEGIKIGNDVWIASGAKILDSSNIKDGCVIGANAVFKGNAEPYGVYVGIPAQRIKERN